MEEKLIEWSIDTYLSTEALWFASIFPKGSPFTAILKPKEKEQWIQTHIQSNASQIETRDGWVTHYQRVNVPRGTFEVHPGVFIADAHIEIREGCVIESGAYLAGPTILGAGTTVRHGAYVRGGVITGEKAMIGHATEIKSAILGNEAKAAHFAYVGDCILGSEVNLGAGTKLSNLTIGGREISVRIHAQRVPTGLRKFGGILGDRVQTGCNAVINPGALLGPGCMVFPCASVKNQYYPAKSIIRA